MKAKRIKTYLLDTLIVLIISFILITLMGDNTLETTIVDINEKLLNNEITTQEYFNIYSQALYKTDTNNLIVNMLTVLVTMVWFIIIPFITKGQTIMAKIFKIEIKYEKINQLFLRSILINGLGLSILSIFSLLVFNNIIYTILIITLMITQITILIINAITLFKNDTTLIDKITNSRIEEKI